MATIYPEEIKTFSTKLANKQCLYVLEVEPGIYKYGITRHIQDRLRTHYRDMHFIRIVEVYDCIYHPIKCKVENFVGKLARMNHEKIRKYDKTEIIQTKDVDKYLEFIPNKIAELMRIPITLGNNVLNEIKPKVVKIIHIQNPNECIHCNKIFSKKDHMIRHLKICKLNKIVELNTFPSIENKVLDEIKPKVAKNNEKFKCNDCGKSFQDNAHLASHKNRKNPCILKVITLEESHNPCKCINCNKIYTNIGNLNKHQKTCKIIDISIKSIKDVVQQNSIQDVFIDNKKCYSCGKMFRTPTNLKDHKDRKTPCVIREIAPEQIANPSRCIYCNNIFSKKSNMIAHLQVCKFKNVGNDVLIDKVQYEHEIRILKERDATKDNQIQQLFEEMKQMKQLIEGNRAIPNV